MTTLEERLRTELPLLADAMSSATGDAGRPAPPGAAGEAETVVEAVQLGGGRGRWWPLVAAAAALALVAGFGVTNGGTDDGQAVAGIATGFGTWAVLPEAPIAPRPHAVAAWTGDEAVFWAGSSLDRSFAYTDGAAYDPETDSWRSIVVPGWGHPGLTGTFFDGELYVLAKGGGARFDPVDGVWRDLPAVESMLLGATVATDEAVWGLGPTALNPSGQPDLAVARYDPAADAWVHGPIHEGPAVGPPVGLGLVGGLDATVHWAGSEIVVWAGTGGGYAFDPTSETWRDLDPPIAPSGTITGAVATTAGRALVVAATVETTGGATTSLAVLEGDRWRWITAGLPIADLDSTTITASGDWLVAFDADRAPITVHLPTGEWLRNDEGPLAGVAAPSTVWAGDTLVVWGGAPADPASPQGATWTPAGE
jgi:hypothetical protein